MAKIIRFPSPERASILAEIRQLASDYGMTWEQATVMVCGEGKTWEDWPTDYFYGPVVFFREDVAEMQAIMAKLQIWEREDILAEIRRLTPACGVSWESLTVKVFEKNNAWAWDDVPTGYLCKLLERMIDYAAKFPARKAKVIPFGGAAAAPVAERPSCSREDAHKRSMIIKVQIALKAMYAKMPGFNDDTYRYILQERWGVNSSTKLNNRQLHELLLHLADIGKDVLRGKIKRGRGGSPDKPPATLKRDTTGLDRTGLMSKIEAMLAEKGTDENVAMPWGYAVAILERQTNGEVKRFEDADPEQLRGVIAALYRDAKRKGRRTG